MSAKASRQGYRDFRIINAGNPASLRMMDLAELRLMVQELAGRVIAVEGEVANLRSHLAALIADDQH